MLRVTHDGFYSCKSKSKTPVSGAVGKDVARVKAEEKAKE